MIEGGTEISAGDVLKLALTQSAERNIEMFEKMPLDQELKPGISVRIILDMLRLCLAPAAAPPGCTLRTNIVYGTAGHLGRELTLHLYVHHSGGNRPGVVFIHGGGWMGGHPNLMSRLASKIAAAGYVTATISYRLSTEAHWPAAVEDAKCAVRWMRTNSLEIGLDASRIAVVGGSAGGHLAAMIALTPGRFEGSGGWQNVSSEVQALVQYAPCLDLSKGNEMVRDLVNRFLGDSALITVASPINQVTSICPPVLTITGDNDEVTPEYVARSFHSALDLVAVPNQLKVVSDFGHGGKADYVETVVPKTVRFLSKIFDE